MNAIPDVGVAAIDTQLTATIDRFSAIKERNLTVDGRLQLLFGCASSLSLITDLPLGGDAQGYRTVGRAGNALMQISESLVRLLEDERSAARQLLARQRSDHNVLASLLGLSVLLNAMLAFVALR
jgi:hypothetical protein